MVWGNGRTTFRSVRNLTKTAGSERDRTADLVIAVSVSELYQRPYDLTYSNHSRLAMDLIVSGKAMRSFHALRQA